MAIDPRVDIGHVHLKVSDIDRALAFYRDVLGFEEMQRYGDQAAFISAGGYHHHIGLNTWESKGGSPPPPGTTGLYHVAIRYPDRKALAQALKQLVDAGIPISGATDHGVSEAIYLRDPDDNGIELYRDRPAGRVAARGGRQHVDDLGAARPDGPARRSGLTMGTAAAGLRPSSACSSRRSSASRSSSCATCTPGNGDFRYLIWNLFLAWIPFALAIFVYDRWRRRRGGVAAPRPRRCYGCSSFRMRPTSRPTSSICSMTR